MMIKSMSQGYLPFCSRRRRLCAVRPAMDRLDAVYVLHGTKIVNAFGMRSAIAARVVFCGLLLVLFCVLSQAALGQNARAAAISLPTSRNELHSSAAASPRARRSHNIIWKGYRWKVSVSGAGGGLLKGSLNNVFVDSRGNLHLRISHAGGIWSGAQLFSQQNFGFGTYQWVLKGTNFYKMDPPVVLGLFNYGPEVGIGTDGENEIDTEFSQWDHTAGRINADFTLYPPTGHLKSNTASTWEDNFEIAPPSANTTTVRFDWTATRVTWTIMAGTVPIKRTANVIKTDTYTGGDADIPQVPLPIAMNLWSFKALPTHPWDITISDFQFVPK